MKAFIIRTRNRIDNSFRAFLIHALTEQQAKILFNNWFTEFKNVDETDWYICTVAETDYDEILELD